MRIDRGDLYLLAVFVLVVVAMGYEFHVDRERAKVEQAECAAKGGDFRYVNRRMRCLRKDAIIKLESQEQ